jgi:hypothetical protein
MLRSRREYYEGLVARVRRRIEESWNFHKSSTFQTREEFDRSFIADDHWKTPVYWWGLNDVIAFIDVRLHSTEIAATLFTTVERPSATLGSKTYKVAGIESVELKGGMGNEVLRREVIAAVERLAADPALRKRYVDLDRWRPLVEGRRHQRDLMPPELRVRRRLRDTARSARRSAL